MKPRLRRRLLALLLAAAAVVLAPARAALAVNVGEEAPELDVAEWIQGGPFKLADSRGSKVWLVAFWGTFELECIETMPLLNKLYEKHRSDGFDIVAVSTEPADVVRAFLASHKLEYNVAIDQSHRTSEAYEKAQHRLPMAWLVDKTGTVVWKGIPSPWALGRVLDDVIAGRFDHKRVAEIQKREQEMWRAFLSGDWDGLAAAAEKVLATEPGDVNAFNWRVWAFRRKDDREGYDAFMKGYVERCKDDAPCLHRAARELALGDRSWSDVGLGLAAAERAAQIAKPPDGDLLETYARILALVGLHEQAIEQQKKAVAAEEKDENHKKYLAYLEACLAARKKAAAPVPKKK